MTYKKEQWKHVMTELVENKCFPWRTDTSKMSFVNCLPKNNNHYDLVDVEYYY